MYKVAFLNGKEIARTEAIKPYINGKFNTAELSQFFHEVSRTISYNNSAEIQFYCCFDKK